LATHVQPRGLRCFVCKALGKDSSHSHFTCLFAPKKTRREESVETKVWIFAPQFDPKFETRSVISLTTSEIGPAAARLTKRVSEIKRAKEMAGFGASIKHPQEKICNLKITHHRSNFFDQIDCLDYVFFSHDDEAKDEKNAQFHCFKVACLCDIADNVFF